MQATRRYGLLALGLILQTACYTPSTRSATEVAHPPISTRVLPRAEGMRVVAAAFRVTPESVDARLRWSDACQLEVTETVTELQVSQMSLDVPQTLGQLALGLGSVGVGSWLAFGVSQDASDTCTKKPGESTCQSPKDSALWGGIAAMGAGAVLSYLATAALFKGDGPEQRTATGSTNRTRLSDNLVPCKRQSALEGSRLRFVYPGRSPMEEIADEDGRVVFALDPRESREGANATLVLTNVPSELEDTLAPGTVVSEVYIPANRPSRVAITPADERMWLALKPLDCRMPKSLSACEQVSSYLLKFPNGRHAGEATEALEESRPAMLRLQADENRWIASSVEACRERYHRPTACDGVEIYLEKYPAGLHANEAMELMKAANAPRPK